MTEKTAPLPPAGWFPDPEVPRQMRWWDGVQWQASLPPQRPSLGVGFAALRSWLVGLLVVHAILDLVLLGTYAWGLTLDSDESDGAQIAVELLAGFATLPVFLALIVVWCLWQYQLAHVCLPGAIRRSPGMNVGSWFIPVVALWFPLQNMRDLWKVHVGRAAGGILGLWWFGWLIGNQLSLGIVRLSFFHDELMTGQTPNVLGLVESGTWYVTSVLAIVVVIRLSRAALVRQATDAA